MKAYVLFKPYDGAVVDIPVPEVGDDEALVKIRYAGLCGTDYSIYRGELSYAKKGQVSYPHRLGHEWSGVVEKVGSAVKNIGIGDRVFSDTGISCGKCEACRRGDLAQCGQIRSLGTVGDYWEGCFAEHFLIPARHLHRMPDGMSMLNAALIEPASISYDAISKLKPLRGGSILIFGTGAIGLSSVAIAKYIGAKTIILAGRSDKKLAVGAKMGATHLINLRNTNVEEEVMRITGSGTDCAFEATGSTASVNLAFQAVRVRGEVALVAFYDDYSQQLDLDLLVGKCLNVFGATGSFESTEKTFAATCNGLDLTPMVSHVLPFDQIAHAFEAPDSTKTKVVVDFGE